MNKRKKLAYLNFKKIRVLGVINMGIGIEEDTCPNCGMRKSSCRCGNQKFELTTATYRKDKVGIRSIKHKITKEKLKDKKFLKILEESLDNGKLVYKEEDLRMNVYCLDWYFSTKDKQKQRQRDKYLLRLKSSVKPIRYIDFFVEEVLDRINMKNNSYTICCIPRHIVGNNEGYYMAEIGKKISNALNENDNNELIDGTECVFRYKDSTSSQHSREPGKHLESIKIINREKVMNKNVLLLDNIVTTGQSMKECMELLRDAGANEVIGIGLGRTVRSTN